QERVLRRLDENRASRVQAHERRRSRLRELRLPDRGAAHSRRDRAGRQYARAQGASADAVADRLRSVCGLIVAATFGGRMAKVSKTVAASRGIKRESLMTLEAYARERKEFRGRV